MNTVLSPNSQSSLRSFHLSYFRVAVLLALAALLAAALPRFSSATRQSNSDIPANVKQGKPLAVPGEIIVRFRSDEAAGKTSRGLQVAAAEGPISLQLEQLTHADFVDGLRLARVAPGKTNEAIEALKLRSDVLYAEPNYLRYKQTSANDPRFTEMWNLKNTGQSGGRVGFDIHAEQAWDVTTGSRSVVVGVVDEGIDVNHSDLKDNVWVNPGETAGNGIDDDANGYIDDVNGWDFAHNDSSVFDYSGATYPPAANYSGDVDDHGTHVAGTIGATGNNSSGVVGVNWQVSLMSLKILSSNGGTSADALKAFAYAKAMRELWQNSGHTRGANITVLNNSYGGGGRSQAEADAIRALGEAGILFIVSAGNSGTNNDQIPTYPSSYTSPSLISVTSTNRFGFRSAFSNTGSAVSLFAPGQNILSTTPRDTYTFFSGTSMAAPHVTGAAALIAAAFPNTSVRRIRSALLYSGDFNLNPFFVATGRDLNAATALQNISIVDSVAPGAVTEFRSISGAGFPSHTLAWQAPGDDGNSGRAAVYEIRLSDSNLSDPADFELATPLPASLPANAGTSQFGTVRLPWRHSNPYIGIRAIDEVGNAGPISVIQLTLDPESADPYLVSQSAAEPLSTGGTPLGLVGDDVFKSVSLPFPFIFHSNGFEVSSVTLSTNGALYFSFLPGDDALSSTSQLNGFSMVAALWDDLRTDRRAGDDIYVVKPDRDRIIFRWQAVTFDSPISPTLTRGEHPVNFEVELRSDGSIHVRYGDGNHNLVPVVGLSGAWPDSYLIDSHTASEPFKDLPNAPTVHFNRRRPTLPPTLDMSVWIDSGPDPAPAGQQITYTVRARNNSSRHAPDVVITNQLPAGASFVSCSTTHINGSCSTNGSGEVTGRLDVLLNGTEFVLTVVAQVNAAVGATLVDTATASCPWRDPNEANNTFVRHTDVIENKLLSGITDTACGEYHTLALQSDGTVLAFGRNWHSGQLGDGTTFSSSTAVPVANLTNVTAVAASSSMSFALDGNGDVWGWGFDANRTPVRMNGLTNVRSIAAGGFHLLALKNDGTVWGWGANNAAQLGTGSQNAPPSTPVQVPGLSDVVSIAGGEYHSLAVKSDGSTWGWGSNINRQAVPAQSATIILTPMQISGLTDIASVSGGTSHSLAVTKSGVVKAWGNNGNGSLGTGSTGGAFTSPVQVANLSGVTLAKAGGSTSFALKSDGTLWGWGQNNGRLGDGTTSNNSPSAIHIFSGVAGISAGPYHAAAVLADHTVRTWGANTDGQLGDGTLFSRSSPIQAYGNLVVTPPSISPGGGGPYTSPQTVGFLCFTPGATIHYTTNGNDPTEADPVIASGSSLLVSQSMTIKARAWRAGWVRSKLTIAVFNFIVPPNPIDDTSTFVRQHYLDFLNREPDSVGWQFWINNINSCGANLGCVEAKRIDTSAAYFLSIEFQQTGYLVHRLYKASFGRRPLFTEFLTDTQTIGNGVVVNAPGWEQLLESNKQSFANAWVARPAFSSIYNGLTDAQYVDTLIANTGATFTETDRNALVNALTTQTRAQVLRAIADNQAFYNSEYNIAFVEMQYFGYLRRNPQDAPDNNLNGFNFWLNKLNEFGGDYRKAEMVRAFLVSTEYRQRFGTP